MLQQTIVRKHCRLEKVSVQKLDMPQATAARREVFYCSVVFILNIAPGFHFVFWFGFSCLWLLMCFFVLFFKENEF